MNTYTKKLGSRGGPIVEVWEPKAQHPKEVYSFPDDARADKWIEYQREREQEASKRREARATAKRAALEGLVNPFKEGDILVNSWGWEQTNIDFYQVVGVKGRSVMICAIKSHEIRQTGFMTGEVEAIKDAFTGKLIRKILQVYVDYSGKPGEPYLPADFGCLKLWDGKPERYSSYA